MVVRGVDTNLGLLSCLSVSVLIMVLPCPFFNVHSHHTDIILNTSPPSQRRHRPDIPVFRITSHQHPRPASTSPTTPAIDHTADRRCDHVSVCVLVCKPAITGAVPTTHCSLVGERGGHGRPGIWDGMCVLYLLPTPLLLAYTYAVRTSHLPAPPPPFLPYAVHPHCLRKRKEGERWRSLPSLVVHRPITVRADTCGMGGVVWVNRGFGCRWVEIGTVIFYSS